MSHGLLNLLLVIIVFGVVVGLINRFLPMAPFIKTLLNVVVAVILVIYILQFFNIIPNTIPIIELGNVPKVFFQYFQP